LQILVQEKKNMTNTRFTLLFYFILSLIFLQANAEEVNSNSDAPLFLGQLYGHISLPNNSGFESIMVQVLGAHQKDPFIYYTSPDQNGYFNLNGILPADSTVQLYISDQKGKLTPTLVSAYVSPSNIQNVGIYEIVMHDESFTQDLSILHHQKHDFTHTGLCGILISSYPDDSKNAKIFAYDRISKQAVSFDGQTIDSNGRFCFFNLDSPSGSDMYDFVVRSQNSIEKTFSFYLPRSTFLYDAEFDIDAALYRPVQSYSLKQDFDYGPSARWKRLNTINLATSEDYGFINYNPENLDNNLVYFPLSNELLEASYFLNGESSDHFFTLVPRTKLFQNANILFSEKTLSDHVYVDLENVFPIKFVTEGELLNFNYNLYYQTWNDKFGSVFVNIDLSQFNLKNRHDVWLNLRNISGQDVGVFQELVLDVENQSLSGFFFNLLPGRYQLFLTNSSGELLWTYEVRSYPNRVQVLASDLTLESSERLQRSDKDETVASQAVNENIDAEDLTSAFAHLNKEFDQIKKEQRLVMNNEFYQHDRDISCQKIPKPSLLDQLIHSS